MKRKLNAVIYRAVKVLTEEIREAEQDNTLVPVVLNVGVDHDTDEYLMCRQADGTIEMFVDSEDEDAIPDIIVFSGDKIGMESGLEFLCDTSVVIVEENDHKALRRRNTSAIHAQAGKFSNFVYLDNCNPNVIVYSNSGPVITEVSRPLEPEYDEDALADELSARDIDGPVNDDEARRRAIQYPPLGVRDPNDDTIFDGVLDMLPSSVAPTTIDYFRRTDPVTGDGVKTFIDDVNRSADGWNDLSNTDALDLGEDDENEDQDA
jgi:hypothetical protein